MNLTNWGDEKGLNVEALHIEMGPYDHYLTVELHSGHRIRITDDSIYVAEPDTPSTRDGKVIWTKGRVIGNGV